MIDSLSLGLFSLGASTAAIILALYLIARSRQPGFGSKGPPPIAEKGPAMPQPPTMAPQESLGVRLKRRIDRE